MAMSAMSAESATSPQTKHTALSVAKSPTDSRAPAPSSRKRTRSHDDNDDDDDDDDDQDDHPADLTDPPPPTNPPAADAATAFGWTEDYERALRQLCLLNTDQYEPGEEKAFWSMIQLQMTKIYGATYPPVPHQPHIQGLEDVFTEKNLEEPRRRLMEWFERARASRKSANHAEQSDRRIWNGLRLDGSKILGAARPPLWNGSRKKRKTTQSQDRESIASAPVIQSSKPDNPFEPGTLQPTIESPTEERAVNGNTVDRPAEADSKGKDKKIFRPIFHDNKLDAASKRFYDGMMKFLHDNRLEEPTSQDDTMTEFDDMFTAINMHLTDWGPMNTMLCGTIYMVYCLARDNRSRLIEAEEELEKEQKKRKWNDDVLWSMINNKCSEVSIRATEQVDQVMKMIKVDAGSDLQQLRNDVVAAVTKYLRIQDEASEAAEDHPMDLPPTPTPPRREGLRSTRSARNGAAKKDGPSPSTNGRADAASTGSNNSSRVAGFEAELDMALLSQQLKRLAAQREADAQTIEHQKLIILRMDQRLQDLESRVAGVA